MTNLCAAYAGPCMLGGTTQPQRPPFSRDTAALNNIVHSQEVVHVGLKQTLC